MQPRALVTGSNGMLGDVFCPELQRHGYQVLRTDIVTSGGVSSLDIRNLKMVSRFIKDNKPSIVFHLAAETDVDKCELNEHLAYETNAAGTENIASACRECDIPIVYISTGAVFDGKKLGGYTEEDKPAPISVYGKSKLKGEQAVRSLLSRYYIIRAGWMVGGYNKDKKFVRKIMQQIDSKRDILAVTDKFGTLTFTGDFAKGIVSIVSLGKYGTYHCVNKGICTRFDIAKKIAEYLDRPEVSIKPVTSDFFPLPAPRGKSEALINHRLACMGMDNMRPWQEALREYVVNFR